MNANSINELLKIIEIREELTNDNIIVNSSIGIRINPLIGSGSIAALSTATNLSKFGIPLTEDTKTVIINLFLKYSFINSLMCHVGSQVLKYISIYNFYSYLKKYIYI